MTKRPTKAELEKQLETLKRWVALMRLAGAATANCCFNVAQVEGPLSERTRETLHKASKKWDEATKELSTPGFMELVLSDTGPRVGDKEWAYTVGADRRNPWSCYVCEAFLGTSGVAQCPHCPTTAGQTKSSAAHEPGYVLKHP